MIEPLNLKSVLKGALFGIIILAILFCRSFFDNRTKIVFCDVGQGDAVYIRIQNRIDVLVDAGPDRKVLSCLGRHMPFYDRVIELAMLSHDQKDHYGGYDYLVDRYRIKRLITSPIKYPSKGYAILERKLKQKNVDIQPAISGLHIVLGRDSVSFYWPKKLCMSSNDNDCSLIFLFQDLNTKILFTGDASPTSLNGSLNEFMKNVFILKIPHHGSKNGLTEIFFRLTKPQISVISVGKNNSYGHPSKEILRMLQQSGTIIKRTDTDGDIVFYTPDL